MKYSGEYPIKDEHRLFYMKYPVQSKKKWYCADVYLTGGYTIPFSACAFDSQEQAKKACDVHNEYHGFSKDVQITIMAKSMGLETTYA